MNEFENNNGFHNENVENNPINEDVYKRQLRDST